jgi:outer membrane protein TolC|tara:strand:- start:654 stop:1985 length:1332 start_codon:yes stop_codon:yes gene_type:complete
MKNYNINLMKLLLIPLSIMILNPVFSQDTLTLEQTLSLALKENIDIKISVNNNENARNQANMGNAGLLPKINLIGSGSYNNGESSLEFATNDFASITDASSETSNINGAIEFSYNIFNGLGSMNTYKKLNKQSNLKSAELQIQIEQILIKSAKKYYDIAFLQEQHAINYKLVEISLERYKRIKTQNEFGNASQLDLLSAEIDLNSDSVNLINISIDLNNAKTALNQILNRKIETNFKVTADLKINKNLKFLELEQHVQKNNNNIILEQIRLDIAKTNKKISNSSLMPRIDVSGQYGYNNTQSNTSLIRDQSNLGLTGYVNFSWNLFDGFTRKTMLESAKIAIETSKLQLEAVRNKIQKDLNDTFNKYKKNINLIEIETRNQASADKFFIRAKEQFYQGQLSRNDFRLAQVDLSQSRSRLNRSIYIAKISELNLYRLSAQIIKE